MLFIHDILRLFVIYVEHLWNWLGFWMANAQSLYWDEWSQKIHPIQPSLKAIVISSKTRLPSVLDGR